MSSSIELDDELAARLTELAASKRLSVSELLRQFVTHSLPGANRSRSSYVDRVFSMGEPSVNLDKALSLAADDEDLETIRKLKLGK